jgi:predicted ribosomally synthesized peptide with nif11-like leader
MAMNDALRFLEKVRKDRAFRLEAYDASGPEAFSAWVSTAGFTFSPGEIDDAFRVLLLKAADEEAAEEIKEIRQWYGLQSKAQP